MKIIH